MRTAVLFGLCLGLTSPAAPAGTPSLDPVDNWHQWRGPQANGLAPKGDPPVRWDEHTNIKWKTPIPGRGSTTPIVWGDQVFVLTAVDTGRKAAAADLPKADPRFVKKTQAPTTYYRFLVLAVDRATGRINWQQTATEQVPHEGHHPTHSYAAGSPTTDGRYVYASFGSQGVYCYDLTGRLQWRRDLGRMETRFGWGEGTSPVLHGDALILNWDQETGSFLTVLDARTGQTRWKVNREEPTSWATPLVVEHRGRTQVVVNGTNRVRSYDLATGALIWQCGGQTVNTIPSPVAGAGLVVCMSGYGGAAAYAIPLDAAGDLTGADRIAWHYDRGTPYVPSPLLTGDRLYFTQGNNALLTCLDLRTGKPVIDRARLPGLTSLYASPAGAAGRIYFVGRDGTTLVLRLGDKLEVLATNRLNDPTDASPAIAGRQLFCGEKNLYCIEEGAAKPEVQRLTPEARALAYLAREVPTWSAQNHCYSCHHNGDAARALYTAIQLGRLVPPQALADTTRWLSQPSEWDHNRGEPGFSDKGLARIQFAAALVDALDAGRVEDRRALARAAELVAEHQHADGSWKVDAEGTVGSPATYGACLATCQARHILQSADARRYQAALTRADRWLHHVTVKNLLDAGAVLLGLEGSNGPDTSAQRQRCLALLRQGQATQGGWGPFVHSPPEPFDTAVVLLALSRFPDQPDLILLVRRGRAYLLNSQKADGSWAETTRPAGAESYAQRLSTCGWATLALLATHRISPGW